MLYDQGISLRRSGYPTCLYSEKNDPRPTVGGRAAARRAVFRPPGRILARKSVFCYRNPYFVNGPFVTLCETVDLASLDRLLKFSFPSHGPKRPKISRFWPFLARKFVFCYRTPNFVNGPFVTLCKAVDLAPFDQFFDFSFLSYGPIWPKMAIF